jgi:hypothetical protein
MSNKRTLPKEISDKMDALLVQAGKNTRAGKLQEGVALALQAWSLMPEPVGQWDFYPQVSGRNMVDDYVSLNDIANAKKWIEITAQMYDDPKHEDHYVLMLEGEAMYKLGDKERAYYVFGRIHELYGRDGFEGEQLEYLGFFMKERAKRSG